jgi:hypothetical protein
MRRRSRKGNTLREGEVEMVVHYEEEQNEL